MSGAQSSLDGRGFVPADFDRDGDVDLFVFNNDQPYLYLENVHGGKRNWVSVQLRGKRSNSHGIGARVRLTAGSRTQVREIHLGSGYLSSPPPEAHFGLADATRIDRLEIRWPTGERQVFEDLSVNNVIRLEEGGDAQYVSTAQVARPEKQ